MLNLDQIHKHKLALDNGDDASQRKAIHSLKSLGQNEWGAVPQPVMQSLVVSLQHQLLSGTKPPLVHKEIAAIVGNMGLRSKSAVPQLIQLLREGIPDCVREAAATALGELGGDAKTAVDPLVELAGAPTNLAIHAVRALSEIGCADHRVRSALVNLWLSSFVSQNNQIQVAFALCKLGIDAKGLVSFLTNHLIKSQDESLRKSAAEALAWCDKSEIHVVPALLTSTLGDKNEEVRKVAQAALDQLRLSPQKAIQLCAKQLKDSIYAEAALMKSGQLAIPALIETLGADEPTTRIKAARILGSFGELAVEAAPALTKVLRDKDAEVRLAAAKSLWNITKKADDVIPVLVQLLEEKRPADLNDSEARRRFLQTVIEALWRIGPPANAAVPALMEKTKDKNRLVSESAHNAVKRIAPARAK